MGIVAEQNAISESIETNLAKHCFHQDSTSSSGLHSMSTGAFGARHRSQIRKILRNKMVLRRMSILY